MKSALPSKLWLAWVWLVGLMLLPNVLVAQSATNLSLQDVLSATLTRADNMGDTISSNPYQASPWLAGLPSLNLSYLGSDERYGVDESEVSLNLPIKSARRRSADNALQGVATGLDEVAKRQRALYYSGLIREAVWSFQLADTQRRFAAQKRQVLFDLQQRQQDLLAAGSTSEYTVLLLQMEIVQVEILQQDFLQQARLWMGRYRKLTGLREMPTEFQEPAPPLDSAGTAQHPQLQALQLAYQQKMQMLRANSTQASDWNVALKAKNLDSDGYNEKQYGLGIDIPLSFFSVARQTDNVEWRSIERDYLLARDQLLIELDANWEQLLNEHDSLLQKKTLLERSQVLAKRITEQLAQLHASNEIAQEIVLRRIMEAVDTAANLALNQILIDQNNAMLRQASGLTL